MQLIEQVFLNSFLLYTYVLARVGGLMLVAPVLGSREIPVVARTLLAIILALLIVPLQLGEPIAYPETTLNYLVLLGSEVAVGLILGLGVAILFSGVQLAGQIISQMCGLSLANVFDPGIDAEVPILSQFFYYLALTIFLVIGGHRKLLDCLLKTFKVYPSGQAFVPESAAHTLVALLSASFELGIRMALPVTITLLLSTILLGMLSRFVPQLNIFALGLSLNAFLVLGGLFFSLGAVGWVFQQQLDPTFEQLMQVFQPAAESG